MPRREDSSQTLLARAHKLREAPHFNQCLKIQGRSSIVSRLAMIKVIFVTVLGLVLSSGAAYARKGNGTFVLGLEEAIAVVS